MKMNILFTASICAFICMVVDSKGYGGNTVTCHDCAKDGCEELMLNHPSRTGRCGFKEGHGKCFVRKDPNNRIYWGCIDDEFWPGVPWRLFNGCTEDWDRSWIYNGKRHPMIWCFCEHNLCNVGIDQLNGTDPGGMSTPRTTTTDNTDGPEVCITGKGSKRSCHHICHIVNGRIQCSCRDGYVLMSDGRSCTDINECRIANGGCSQICTNTRGSYRCSCRNGYYLASDTRSCLDINECAIKNGGCSHTCGNMDGYFICSCPTGYTLLKDAKTCQDVNECLNNNGGCTSQCTNTPGSFYCECPPGYELTYDHSCRDINECVRQIVNCEGSCLNTQGSYRCSCNIGFELQKDGVSCADIDECSLGLSNCVHTCINTYGSYMCQCQAGYTLSTDSQSCIDINECLLPGQAGCEHICMNTQGSYTCACHQGFRLHLDRHSCVDDNECRVNNGGCAQICTNMAGGVQCSCFPGYEPFDYTQCRDIDECAFNNGGCEQTCTNIPGSYQCSCNRSDLFVLAPDRHSCLIECPDGYVRDNMGRSCYLIVTPRQDQEYLALDYYQAERECQRMHPESHLVTVEDITEKEFLKRYLQQTTLMLEGWQGWWTSAKYQPSVEEFVWSPYNQIVDEDSPLWSFKKQPYADTCLWIMQPAPYDYTWGNFECETKSGYICEISVSSNQ